MRALTAQLKELRALGKRLDEQEKVDIGWSGTATQFDLVMPPILPADAWESIAVQQQQALLDPDAPPCTYQCSFFRSQRAFLRDVPAKDRHHTSIPLVVKDAQDLKWLYIVPLVPLDDALENERLKATDPDYVEPEHMSREFSLAMADMDSWPVERLAPYLANWERDFAGIQPAAPIDHSLPVANRLPASADDQVFNGASRFAESQGQPITWTGLPLCQKLKIPEYLMHLGIDPERFDALKPTLPGEIIGFIEPGDTGGILELEGMQLWAEVMPMLPTKQHCATPPTVTVEPGRIRVSAATGWLVAHGDLGTLPKKSSCGP
ncbi:hypothetical protein [Pseudomonas oryzihabitans]|uniref:hypothetical protein n=1 Tax=Pseudomonas oryzihabitans TaxID=47885 RepID=UPI0005AB496C|nr:hypothetical protein [Pseudomonas oryzihabitans]NMZ47047.1 hypothetical protein [Pseudomonas oryzihabitans]